MEVPETNNNNAVDDGHDNYLLITSPETGHPPCFVFCLVLSTQIL